MKKHLIAAVAVLTFSGSAFAQEPVWSGQAKLVGLIAEAARQCGAESKPVLTLMAERFLRDLPVSYEQARVWINDGAQRFDNEEARYGTGKACDQAYATELSAYEVWAKYHCFNSGTPQAYCEK